MKTGWATRAVTLGTQNGQVVRPAGGLVPLSLLGLPHWHRGVMGQDQCVYHRLSVAFLV